MTYKITVTYNPSVVKEAEHEVASICALFQPDSAACDMEAFDGTYYDTNVKGCGFGTEFEDFIAMQVSHPGLAAAMKAAVEDESNTFEMVTEDAAMKTMVAELNRAMAAAGFSFEWSEE